MRISTYIACRNHGKYLWEAAESCLRQTLYPHELILIDDASTDESRDVMRQIAAGAKRSNRTKVRTIFHDDPIGHIRAYNEGINIASGEYLHLMAADDVLLRDDFYADALYHVMRPQVGFVTCSVRHIGPAGELLDGYSAVPDYLGGAHPPEIILRKMVEVGNFVCGGGTVVRAKAQKPYDPYFPYTADFKLWIEILRDGWWGGFIVGGRQTPVYGYRQHPGAMSSKSRGTPAEREGCSNLLIEALVLLGKPGPTGLATAPLPYREAPMSPSPNAPRPNKNSQ